MMFCRIDDFCRKSIDGTIRILFIGRNSREKIPSDLCTSLYDRLQIFLRPVVAADNIAERLSHGDSAVSVAELSVIVHFEAAAH